MKHRWSSKRTQRCFVADTQLYKRLCPSVDPSVRSSVRPSVHNDWVDKWEKRISAPAHLSATGGRVSGLVVTVFKQAFECFEYGAVSNWRGQASKIGASECHKGRGGIQTEKEETPSIADGRRSHQNIQHRLVAFLLHLCDLSFRRDTIQSHCQQTWAKDSIIGGCCWCKVLNE